ncbi:MAG TPA: AsmA-like C-terminal region-containing protein, partial [Verrucomicrobiae bacterium]
MAKQEPSGRWRRFRVIFRRCRITLLLVILAFTGGLLYLNSIGLPGFIKKPLLQKLHDRGLDMHFTRLRWRPVQGIVAENVFFGRTNDVSSPQLTARDVQLRLDYRAMLKRQFQVNSLALRDGRLAWPVVSSNEPPRELSIEKIQTDVQLLTNDVWELDDLHAQFAGADIQISGALTNASAVREWKLFSRAQPPRPGTLQNRLRHLADALEQTHFAASPRLRLDLRGDARNVDKTSVRFFVNAPGADTPWGIVGGVRCSVLLTPPRSNQLSRAEINLQTANADTRWGATTNLALTLQLFSGEQDTNIVRAELELTADSVHSRSNHADNVHFTAQWLDSLTNGLPISGRGELQASNAVTPWGSARQIHLAGALLPSTNPPAIDARWAWWTNFAAYPVDLECSAYGVHSPKLDVDEIRCAAQWHGPNLSVEKLSAKLYGGTLNASARLNVATRATTFDVTSDFDAKKITPLLTPMAREWMANYSWNYPPHVQSEGSFTLPVAVWTNRNPDWRGELRPTLWLNGQFHAVDGAFRGIHALTADSHFSYSNMCWRLPDLVATRPEGRLIVFHESNDRTKDFYFRAHSTIDPLAVRPLLDTNQQRILKFFSLTQPPVVDGEVWGKWHEHDRIHARAHVAVTNFTVRGESADYFQTALEYTNRILTLLQPQAQRAGTQELSAASMKLVFDEQKIFLTNGLSTADPEVVARVIGPHVTHAIEPYHFLRPPVVRAEGIIPMRHEEDADLHFQVDGGDFEWWKFQLPRVTAKIDWVGEDLALTNIRTEFYLGKASGAAHFEFNKMNHNANFNFNFIAADANLHLLAKDLADGKTNKLEGLLTARIEITNGITGNWQTLQGAGRVDLRDGLIWDIPIFGIFSPVLDTVMPGLGSSRARQGSASFVITNGVIDSEDLKIETLMARLRYRGTIDMKGIVNARMEAELLRNTWVIGPVLSLALWPVSKTFEYQITGTIHKPKSEPVYIPRIFFLPLHPVQTIKDMIPEQTAPATNGPPATA